MKIIAGIPAYNEEKFIGKVIKETKKYVDKVLVVDDGSTDKTSEIAKNNGALVIRHKKNIGYGGCLKTIFKWAKKNNIDILTTLDGDGQHEPNEIPKILLPIIKENSDLVIGSRFIENRANIPKYRKFGINIITLLTNILSKTKFSDTQSGFRAYNRKALNLISLTERRFGASIETLLQARLKKFKIKEIAISCSYHPGSNKLNPFIHGFSVAFVVAKLRFINLIKKFFSS